MADQYEGGNDRYEDVLTVWLPITEEPRYARDRSASPGRGNGRSERTRSMSPPRNESRAPPSEPANKEDEEGAVNPGSNLFVTGIHPRLTESDVTRLFEKYGDVESCSIMLDPHTKESRGFGFVKMTTSEQADAAKEGLQGEVIEGRTLSIEKARRSRPRTPTPGKYFGPPKRGVTSSYRGYRGGGRGYDRYDDRRYGRRYDDYRGGGRYDSYYSDRRYDRREMRDDWRGGDRYRDDRYSSRDDRRGGDDRRSYYDRDSRSAYPSSTYDAPPPPPRERESYPPRSYEARGDDRYGGPR
ncbi:hypothetical protein KEM54_003954 [Ascosphaera aggregata]|nr:hypothetical protein KEM54_003954 [Ascosphaera aggregata]